MGAVGAVLATGCGVTALEAGDAAPVPFALAAATVNVYVVPVVRPVIVALAPAARR